MEEEPIEPTKEKEEILQDQPVVGEDEPLVPTATVSAEEAPIVPQPEEGQEIVTDEEPSDPPTEEPAAPLPGKPLTKELVSSGISLLARTGNGISHAYTKLDIHGLEVDDITILKNFVHLRYVVNIRTKIYSCFIRFTSKEFVK